ncbi:uncharacterized protein LOC104455801 [Eucalyptus grandis]|uniref:Uncharacterized protein n=2 Tax=Eucalyptus grandis TaxID=71139 RepID=A0A059BGP4_EUCGR|nr:uncharacterized protein LOC104455801 [Eucalyptus grandis]KAK3422160.1 hypothetical protein EUGRSUZ_G02701 [Eucalyptus grandis]
MANLHRLMGFKSLSFWVMIVLIFFPWQSLSSSALPGLEIKADNRLNFRRVRCRLPFFGRCFLMWFTCPLACPTSCFVDCNLCRPVCSCNYPGAVCQDPRFVGGDGNTFFFHGQKDRNFCLVSDPNFHINAHFIGKRNPSLKRDFTWVQSIGIVFGSHNLLVGAKRASTWDDRVDHLNVILDGAPVSLPPKEGYTWRSLAAASSPALSISRSGETNGLTVEVENNFRITMTVVPITAEESRVHGYNITDDDCFAHLELGFKFYNLTDFVDGVLGQTYRKNYVSKARADAVMPVMGGANKYATSSIFATDCLVSRFGQPLPATSNGHGLESLLCKSGIEGSGMVCRK